MEMTPQVALAYNPGPHQPRAWCVSLLIGVQGEPSSGVVAWCCLQLLDVDVTGGHVEA